MIWDERSSWLEPNWRGRRRFRTPIAWTRLPTYDVGVAILHEKKSYGRDAHTFLYFRKFNEKQIVTVPVLSQTYVTSSPGSNQSITLDANTWNTANNKIEVVGGGARGCRGASTSTGGGGGGGGAYTKIVNCTLAAGTSVTVRVGIGQATTDGGAGGDSWFNDTVMPTSGTNKAGAKGGASRTTTLATGGAGGDSASGYADPAASSVKNSGGAGGNGTSNTTPGGGGGAAGPNGVGLAGKAGNDGTTPRAGGAGDNGSGGAGGVGTNTTPGAAGNPGTELGDGSHGCGGGGGGGTSSPSTGGQGGLYGGGGAGGGRSTGAGGNGRQGIVVVTWVPLYVVTASTLAFNVTGTDANLEYNRFIPTTSGSVEITGTDASLEHSYTLTADSGSVAITGVDATLGSAHAPLVADSGSISISGISATLKVGYKVWANLGQVNIATGRRRVTAKASQLTRQTAVNADGQKNVLRLQHVPDDNSTWYYFLTALLDCSTTTNSASVRLRQATQAIDLGNVTFAVADIGDNLSLAMGGRQTYGALPGQQTIDVDLSVEASATAGLSSIRLDGLEASANDKYTTSDTETTDTTGTFSTKVTLSDTFTGSYLFLFSAEVFGQATAGQEVEVRGDIDGTKYGAISTTMRQTGSIDFRTWFTGVVKTGLTGSHTAIIEFRRATAGSPAVRIRKARIVAIPLSEFMANFYEENRSRTTTTSITEVDKTTLTQTTAVGEHLIVGGLVVDGNNATISTNAALEQDATDISLADEEPRVANNSVSYLAMSLEDLTAASHTWKTQFFSETGTLTTGASESWISVIDLAAAPTSVINFIATLSPASGSFLITGVDATLTKQTSGYTLTTDPGSFVLTGGDVALKVVMPATSGTFDVTGISAVLREAHKLIVDSGFVNVTGVAANLREAHKVAVAVGSFTIGDPGTTTFIAKVPASSGSIVIVGTDANLSKTGGARTLTAGVGLVDVVGIDATLKEAHKFTVNSGSVSISGTAVGFKTILPVESGSIVLTGSVLNLIKHSYIQAVSGSEVISGQAVSLEFNPIFHADPGVYVWTGLDANLTHVIPGLGALVGAITLKPRLEGLVTLSFPVIATPSVRPSLEGTPSIGVE